MIGIQNIILLLVVLTEAAEISGAPLDDVTRQRNIPTTNITDDWVSELRQEIQDKVNEGLQKLRTDLEKKQEAIRKSLNTDITGTEEKVLVMFDSNQYFYYPKNTKKHVAKYYYPLVGARFAGFGWPNKFTTSGGWSTRPLHECILYCKGKHSSDATWNGIAFDPYDIGASCICLKEDVGHTPAVNVQYLHYHFV